MTTILIVAGETSGDLHGANLARALRTLDPSVRLAGAGGAYLRAAGVETLADPTDHASVGIVEAFRNFHRYAQLYRKLQSALRALRPDAAVLIDSPDFNLRFAARAADHGVPVVYYVSPQIWAWRPGRIRVIRRLVRKMLVILDFEERLYRDAGVDVTFVGHPLLDAARPVDREAVRREFGGDPLIGLLPGSRASQFAALFPILRRAAELIARDVPGARFVVACAPAIDPRRAEGAGFAVVHNRTPEVMAASDLLLTASGTATLEAAIYGTPMIVTYRLNPLTALTLGPLIRVKHYALVNIVAGREIMPEYYQFRARPELIAREAVAILREGRLPGMRRALEEVRRRLGEPGASLRAAREVLAVARERRRPGSPLFPALPGML
ncbi:MAG TPA: lipid-A-disaccharide synthase [Planctomycetota bacterium]|jgi:lipid-A-disaccharide synthase|nr:lipid-A-disaccharide synthase [Planctomycetota bacterium]